MLFRSYGKWNQFTSLPGGMLGSGVTSVFDSTREISTVLSPLSNVMAISHTSPYSGRLVYGIMGNSTSIPANMVFQTVLYVTAGGPNRAVRSWGTKMRAWYGKQDTSAARQRDFSLQYIGYTTDNGAYYYYNTIPGENYQQTMFAVKDYAQSLSIPYQYIEIDSWFYYKGSNGGTTNWTARPDVFPDGMEAIYNYTGWLLQAHNRYWSDETPYATHFPFLNDESTGGAVPLTESFWNYLFGTPVSAWGLRVYEQDWLFNEMDTYVTQMLEDITLARQWLLQMGSAAAQSGINIQYCMPYIRFVLQSLEIEVVTQARASDDYVAGLNISNPLTNLSNVPNWKIGGQSLLFDALGLVPSKDGFWTTSVQPGNPYGLDRIEPFPRLESAVATLSAGPVQIGDGIGYSDTKLILKSCRKDGRLLQASRPATPIDAAMRQSALQDGSGPTGEVWFAPSLVSGRVYGYLFVAELAAPWTLHLRDLPDLLDGKYWAVESNLTSRAVLFSGSNPLRLSANADLDFQVWTITPFEGNGVSLFGEFNKWVGVSAARIEGVFSASDDLEVMVRGVDSESITIGFIDAGGSMVNQTCTIGPSTTQTISYANGCS